MKRSKFGLSDYKLLTGDMGVLYPVGLTAVLPGDTIRGSTSVFLRMSPMLAPVMHPCTVRIHHWLVSSRILWPGWEDFITGGPDGMDASMPPQYTVGAEYRDTLLDYMQCPAEPGMEVNALPFAAYQKIFNEFYRDQDLRPPVPEDGSSAGLRSIMWEKDYFTTARPWVTKGPDITIPIAGTAPVKGIGKANQTFNNANELVYESGGTGATNFVSASLLTGDGAEPDDIMYAEEDPNNPGFMGIYADLSESNVVSPNDIREAFALQRYQEARARYGSRFTEYLRYLGVRSSDGRLQRPEFLAGGKATINFSEVLQTVDDEAGQERGPLGKLGGHGMAALKTNTYQRFIEEHGYILTLLSVRPKTIYQDGINREFLKDKKEDYWQKELEGIGQQALTNNEVFADAVDGKETFGYQDRYSEYKRGVSSVAGEFRDLYDYWHLARQFDQPPGLNQNFVTCDPSKRIFADQTGHGLQMMVVNRRKARRLVKRSPESIIR